MKVIRWQTPWPMIQISESEWVIMRDHPARPAALVRHLGRTRDSKIVVGRNPDRPSQDRAGQHGCL